MRCYNHLDIKNGPKEATFSRFPSQIIFELTSRNIVLRGDEDDDDDDVPFQRLNFPCKRFGPRCTKLPRVLRDRDERKREEKQAQGRDFLTVELQSKLCRSASGIASSSLSFFLSFAWLDEKKNYPARKRAQINYPSDMAVVRRLRHVTLIIRVT